MSQLEQQMRHRDKEMVPRFLVQAMFALMIGTLGIVAYAQWTNVPDVGVLEIAPIQDTRDVVLVRDAGGVYQVVEPGTGALIASSADDKAGFLGVMGRVVDHERHKRKVTGDTPIQVVRRENGHIAVLDATTGLSVELIGYGADNVAAFANLLK